MFKVRVVIGCEFPKDSNLTKERRIGIKMLNNGKLFQQIMSIKWSYRLFLATVNGWQFTDSYESSCSTATPEQFAQSDVAATITCAI